MNNYLQLLISIVVTLTGTLIVLFYFFFRKVNDSNQRTYINQDTEELRKTDFSQTTQILNYLYITLVAIFLLVIYLLVPRQRLG